MIAAAAGLRCKFLQHNSSERILAQEAQTSPFASGRLQKSLRTKKEHATSNRLDSALIIIQDATGAFEGRGVRPRCVELLHHSHDRLLYSISNLGLRTQSFASGRRCSLRQTVILRTITKFLDLLKGQLGLESRRPDQAWKSSQ